MTERMIPESEVVKICNTLIKSYIAFPFGQMYVHLAAHYVMDEMEKHNLPLPPAEIQKAIVKAHDDIVLAWEI